ncbi:MAG: beta-ketoacyl-ACP synthase II [Alphaproteobacteria bacterium]|nr:MAG: beta-ketoacyl-ACP synthase II [Alphaproteobacteria bacterium]
MREVWITGIGLVSCFGEGAEHHWRTLGGPTAPAPIIDCERFKPYCVHPLPEMDWSKQIPRRGDQRQMENWQRLGTYAAGLALEDCGFKDNEELVSTMDLVVAAGGGERDIAVDEEILREAAKRNDRDMLLNERLPFDLRPTLFLAQLSNLLAGNISIVHKVTGSSRTYMGEEGAGITAIENGLARIRAGQSTHLLVGGAFNAERIDLLLSLELGHFASRSGAEPVWARQASGGGTITGSVGAFIVLEEAEHARARGARPYARLAAIVSDLGPRDNDDKTRARIDALLDRLPVRAGTAVMSGASGCKGITGLEFDTLRRHLGEETAIRAYTTMIGNAVEANFPAGVALAALALFHKGFYPPFEEAEKPLAAASKILVSSIGHYRGEGFALVEPV